MCALVAALFLLIPAVAPAASPRLTRYPYLTDVVATGGAATATINWATDQSQATGYATYGAAGAESATSHGVTATRASISVNGVPEYQWTARVTGLDPGTAYAYRTFLGDPGIDLLSGEGGLRFTTPAADPATPYSFAVMGDWGANPSGVNPDQANLDAQVAASGASFVLSTGDTANPAGNQANYGDLQQTGPDLSNVFGPAFYKAIGAGMPLFGAPGNHGFNSTFLDVWPEAAAATSSAGRYQMDSYSLPGTATASYPSVWYAFTVGNARFYVLTAAWANSNVGSGTLYSNDRAAHWTPTSPEYRWLADDLATHPAPLKFAVFHFPMYTDNSTEATDTYLHGPDSLAALLGRYDVQFVFNGHAHIYERNLPQPGEGFVSYVVGGGGSLLEPVSLHGAFDAYAIGWSPTSNTGSARGAAPVPASPAQVYSFLLVTVSPGKVTVTPVDSLGSPFDVQTYPIPGTSPAPDTTPPTATADGVVPGAWLQGAVVVHLTATDGAGSGVATISYSLDGATPVVVPGASVDVTVTGDGRHQITYWARDLAGNEEGHQTLGFAIDSQAPSNTAGGVSPGAWLQAPAVVHLTATDGAGSGVASISYSVDGSAVVVAPGVSVDVSLSGDGRHQISYWAKDRAGNEGSPQAMSFGIDDQPPSTAVDGDGQWHNRPVALSFLATDQWSGVQKTEFRVDEGSWLTEDWLLIPAPSDHSWDGVHTILFRSVDVAGNVEPMRSAYARIDTRQPTTRAPRSAVVRRGRTATLVYRVNDGQPSSGRARVEIRVRTTGGKLVTVLKVGWGTVGRDASYSFRCTLPRGRYGFKVYATDSAGNRQEKAAGNRLLVK